jgi:hypothetical protein
VLATIRDVARARGLTELAEEITEDYLIHKRKQNVERFRVLPRIGDRDALKAIIEGENLAPFAQLRLVHAWRFFRRQILHHARRNPDTALRNLFDTITQRISLVVITIDGENPYEIFESLNATGLPLAESDLIRNFVFMQVPLADQDAFDRDHWSPLERNFASWGDDRSAAMTDFYRDYLMRNGCYSREKSTFVGFKQQQDERGLSAEAQALDLQHYAPLAVQIRKPEMCKSARISRCLSDISLTDIGTARAFVMHLLDRHARGNLTEDSLLNCLCDLISFVLRRTVCGESTRPYSRWFVEAIGVIGVEPVEDLRRYWFERGWPDDAAFTRGLGEFQLYKREPRKARMMLEALERAIRHKEQVVLQSLTIEHVLPQTVTNDDAGKAWMDALGADWEDLHERYVHVLGNLTLTGYNPELGKMGFADKQAVYRDSHIGLNRHFNGQAPWNAESIKNRTTLLAGQICQIWPRPTGGQSYATTLEEDPNTQQASPARRRNLEYWKAFLKHWEEGLGLPRPMPSDTAELIIPMDKERGISIHLWQYRRERKMVAYVRFEGKRGRGIYNRLHEVAKEIDDRIEGDLVWDWPVKNSFAVSEEDIDFSDPNDWEIQHAWLNEELSDLVEALIPELAQDDEHDDDEQKECEGARARLLYRFWTELLAYAVTRTDLHANRKPGAYGWIGGGIGRSGFGLNYSVREHKSKVEMYIDLGKDSQTENKRAFAALKKDREAIEKLFGGPLEWQDLASNRACRVCNVINGGWRSAPETWGETHTAMVDAMIRMDKALRSYVHALKLS